MPGPGRKPGWGKGLKRRILLLVTPEKYAEIKAAAGKASVNEWVRGAIDARLEADKAT